MPHELKWFYSNHHTLYFQKQASRIKWAMWLHRHTSIYNKNLYCSGENVHKEAVINFYDKTNNLNTITNH